jgi:hypothetical protein
MKDGHLNFCRDCEIVKRRKYQKIWKQKNLEVIKKKAIDYRNKNKDKINAQKRERYKINKEKILLQCKKYREKNKEKIKEKQKIWVRNNKDRLKVKRREHYINNREDVLKKQKIYSSNNKDKIRERSRQWTLNNKNHKKQVSRIYNQKLITELDEKYVLQLLNKNQKDKNRNVPKELIEAKRLQILIQREIKNLNKGELV